MIRFPEIDLKDRNIRIMVFVITLLLLFFNNFETKTLLSILVIIVIVNLFVLINQDNPPELNLVFLGNFQNFLLNPYVCNLNKNIIQIKI
mgnify:CR=1 FL=1